MLKLRERHKGRRCCQTAMPADGLIAAHSHQAATSARPVLKGSSPHITRCHAPEKEAPALLPEWTRPGFLNPGKLLIATS
jgi:hypothetical protein